MLYIDFKSLLEARNISHPHKFLLDNGFTKPMAYRILHQELGTVRLTHLFRLCKLLNCTPNDVIRYKPSLNEPLNETHPLNKIKGPAFDTSAKQLLESLSPEELKAMAEIVRNRS